MKQIIPYKPRPNDYPFGSSLNTRSFSAGNGFRFGFNGKENFDKYQDYGFRIYYPELGKFLSVDPLTNNFAWNSVFSFSENCPIWGIDLDGGEFQVYLNKLKLDLYVIAIKTERQAVISANIVASSALVVTAKTIYPGVEKISEATKQEQFKYNPQNSVAILLYEFATGKGKDNRTFVYGEPGSFANDFIDNRISKEVINGINKEMSTKTLSEFKSKGFEFPITFSPDQTSFKESINKHLSSSLSQLFVGGAIAKVTPTIYDNRVNVEIINYTSRKSLMLHLADNYIRDANEAQKDQPLSTIKQTFIYSIEIDPSLFKKEEQPKNEKQ